MLQSRSLRWLKVANTEEPTYILQYYNDITLKWVDVPSVEEEEKEKEE